MEGEESILSIANFLEATKPASKVEKEKSDGVANEKGAGEGKESSKPSDNHSIIETKNTSTKIVAETVTPNPPKNNPQQNYSAATQVATPNNPTNPMHSKPVVAKKSKPVPDDANTTHAVSEPGSSKETFRPSAVKASTKVVSKAPNVVVVHKPDDSDPAKSKPASYVTKPSLEFTKSIITSSVPKPTANIAKPVTLNLTKPTLTSNVTTPSSDGTKTMIAATTKPKPTADSINPKPTVPNSKVSPAVVSTTPVHITPSHAVPSTTQANLPTPAADDHTSTQDSIPPAVPTNSSNLQPGIPATVPSTTLLPTKPEVQTLQGPLLPCPSSLPVSTLSSLTTLVNSSSHLHSTALLYLSQDSLRNLCDGVQALDLSGETDCSDMDTLTLYRAVLNIQLLSSKLVIWSTTDFLPFTNLSCRTLHCHHLQKLVYKEPNLKGIILSKVGQEDFNQFDQLTDFYMGRGDMFICENTDVVIYLYHRIRNLSLQYVLTKLYNVYVKMKPIFKQSITDPVYNTSVTNLTRLMNSPWNEQVTLSEENGYDFDFLITILMYWKKAKDNPIKPTTTDSDTTNPPVQESTPPVPSSVPKPPTITTSSEVDQKSPNSASLTLPRASLKLLKPQISKPVKPTAVEIQPKEDIRSTAEIPAEVIVNSPANEGEFILSSQVSVLSLHQLKTFLDQSAESRQRVMKGVGQQAYKEFNNLVTSLQDMSMVIGDTNVKTLYFTIINFANHPVTVEMKKYEPLSNFSLKFEPFHDLKTLLLKDENIRKIVTSQMGVEVVDKFLQQVDKLAKAGTDFVLTDQESNIVLYHKFRNCVIDNLMTRLKVVHSKIQVVQLTNTPPSYTIGVKMLQSLMATHYNGQVLMMEKSKFDFDFLTTILEFLQQCKDNEETQGVLEVKVMVKPSESKDKLAPIVSSTLIEIADIGLVQSIENLIGADVCKEYIAVVKAIDMEKLNLKQKKAVHSLKNAIFFFKNNLKCEDLPLTNLSLEADKFSYLLKFIGKDAGIRTAINEKYGEVALKELEALVTAHDERGDEFISKFIEKNVKLYHSLRNTAMEKILRQISVVHGKVKNIDLPETARNSTQYHIAIKRLDSIVDSDFNHKILLIEDLKFEFDFLSTILLVWRTETTKQAEAEEAKKASAAEKNRNSKPAEIPVSKTEPSTTIIRHPEVQETPSPAQKPIVTERRIRTTSTKVEHMFVDDPDDPDAVDAEDPNDPDFDPNSIDIVVEDDFTAELELPPMFPAKVHNNTMVLHRATSSPRQTGSGSVSKSVKASVTPVRATMQSAATITRPVTVSSPTSRPRASVNTRTEDVAHIVPVAAISSPEVLQVMSLSQTPRSVPPKIATPSHPMPMSPGWGEELPIKTKCTQCPDKTSDNVEQLVHHYSFMHYREEIEKKHIRGGDICNFCNEEFKLKFNLIKHLGLVHNAVQVDVSETERWICHFCKKEFLSDEFLRKHLIRLHLEKKFESSFLALSETNEILCQFCEKTFSYKKNLFCHIGIDHDKLPEVLPNYNRNDIEDDMKCRHCDFESSLTGLKTHYVTTHYKESFENLCQQEDLVSADLSCRYCQVIFSDRDSLVQHIGVEHNRVYRFISHFQGKNVDIICKPSSVRKAVGIKVSDVTKKEAADLTATDIVDPLSTETVFIDTDQDVTSATPTKPQIKIVSPTKLLSRQNSNILKSSNIVSNQSMGNNNTPKPQQTKRHRSSSPKSDPKLKRQDTSKWCNKCSKNFLASKYEAHIILKHLNQIAVSELKREQSLVSCHGLQCPNKSCVQANRFINIESLLVHFITKHSKLLQSKLAASINTKNPDSATKDVQNKSKTFSNIDLGQDISNDSTDLQTSVEADNVQRKQVTSSPWVDKFKTFCNISSHPEAKSMLNSKFKTMSPVVLEKFLTHLCQTPSIIPQLEEVISALSPMFSNDYIKTLPTVVRHLLLLDYQKHCSTVGTSMQVCNPMQVVIMLSQLLAKPGVKPEDLEWLVRWVSKMHDKVEGRLLIENKKITDFFEAVGFKLQVSSPETFVQVKQEMVEKLSFPCEKCGTKFNKRIGLVRHRDRCGDGQIRDKQAGAARVSGDREVTPKVEDAKHAPKVDDAKHIPKVEDTKQVAAKFKAKRISLGLGQKQVLVHMKNLIGPELKVQTIDVAKFELNHNQQAMTKFLPLAQAWLDMQSNTQSPQNVPNPTHSRILTQVQIKTEPTPTVPQEGQLSSSTVIVDTSNVSSTTLKSAETSLPRVDIIKLKLSPKDFTSTINLAVSPDIVQEPREREKLATTTVKSQIATTTVESDIVDPEIVEAEPECIDLDEEDKVYRYFCLECEGNFKLYTTPQYKIAMTGCVGSPSCDHTSHPRVPLQFDISTHIAMTGHVAVSPITGFLPLPPMSDLAYSLQHGADVRKQWKDLVLAGSYIPSQFTGVKRCKWIGCREIFEDAVEAFKHIRDMHLKPKQTKQASLTSLAPPVRSPLQLQLPNSAQKRKPLPPTSSSIPAMKMSRLGADS